MQSITDINHHSYEIPINISRVVYTNATRNRTKNKSYTNKFKWIYACNYFTATFTNYRPLSLQSNN